MSKPKAGWTQAEHKARMADKKAARGERTEAREARAARTAAPPTKDELRRGRAMALQLALAAGMFSTVRRLA